MAGAKPLETPVAASRFPACVTVKCAYDRNNMRCVLIRPIRVLDDPLPLAAQSLDPELDHIAAL